MKPTIDYQFILLFLAIWETDGNVNIVQTGVRAGDASFECGTELVLSCQIGQSSIYMTWQNDSSVTPLAECVMDACTLDDTVAELYNITSDISTRTFNLTIFQVSFDNNNTIYTCSDGTDSNSTLATVKDYEPTVNESITGEIKVSCGCIDPSTKLSLEVIKLKNGSENESRHHPKRISPSFITTACTGDINCVHSNFVQMSKWITVKRGGDRDYRLKVVFIYNDDFRVESDWTKNTYEIKDCPVCVCDDCSDCCILLIVAGCAYLIHIFLGLRLFVTWKDKYNSTEDKYFASSFEYHIVLCDLLWIVMFTLYIASIIICYDCDCSKIVRVVGMIFLTLLGIHIILGCILLYVLYCRKITVVENDKCSTSKGTFIRSVCSAIPVAGLFAVCHWLISVCCSERHVMHNKTKDPLEKGRTEKKGSKDSETFPNLSPKKSGRKMSKSAQRRENKKIDKHLSTERSDLSGKGETDKVSTSGVILKKKTNDKNDFSMSKDSSTAVETARNNVPPYSTAHHNEKGIRSKNRSDNGGIVTNSSSKKKKKTSRTKHDTSGDLHKPFSTEEQTSTSHGNVKHVNVLDSKKKSDGSPSPSTEKSSNPSKSHITSPNSTKEDQIKSHSAEVYAKSETMTRALSANFTDDDDDTAEVSDDRSKTLNMANTAL